MVRCEGQKYLHVQQSHQNQDAGQALMMPYLALLFMTP